MELNNALKVPPSVVAALANANKMPKHLIKEWTEEHASSRDELACWHQHSQLALQHATVYAKSHVQVCSVRVRGRTWASVGARAGTSHL